MDIGLDVGTMFLVKASTVDSNEVTYESVRNVFLEVKADIDTMEFLESEEIPVEQIRLRDEILGTTETHTVVLGEDAIKLQKVMESAGRVRVGQHGFTGIDSTRDVGDLQRPMRDGFLNAKSERLAVAVILRMIGNLVGTPSAGEGKVDNLCFCKPSNPVGVERDTGFHESTLKAFLSDRGFKVFDVPEAQALIYSEQPTSFDPVTNKEMPYTGIGFSFGAGLCNVAYVKGKFPIAHFSILNSGDWIDRVTAESVNGVSISQVRDFKERQLHLTRDYKDSQLGQTLQNSYRRVIENALETTKYQLRGTMIEFPVDIVIGGGTAIVPGFIELFNQVLDKTKFPFKVRSVSRVPEDRCLRAVARGCMLRAISEGKRAQPRGL